MKIFLASIGSSIQSAESLEMAIWCLVGLREKLRDKQKSFDDAIVNTCIDLIYRELLIEQMPRKNNSDISFEKLLQKHGNI